MAQLFTVNPGEAIFSFYMRGKPLNVAGRSPFSSGELVKMLKHVQHLDKIDDVKALSPGEEIQLSAGLVVRKLSKEDSKKVLDFYKTAMTTLELLETIHSASNNKIFFDSSFKEAINKSMR